MEVNQFDQSLESAQSDMTVTMHQSLIDTNLVMGFAKKMLLQNRVQNFQATDVVQLTQVILQRESDLNSELLTNSLDK